LLCRRHFQSPETATTTSSSLSLHDALPIYRAANLLDEAVLKGETEMVDALLRGGVDPNGKAASGSTPLDDAALKGHLAIARWPLDRKSTRLNSSHLGISYAVFCLKKKNKTE